MYETAKNDASGCFELRNCLKLPREWNTDKCSSRLVLCYNAKTSIMWNYAYFKCSTICFTSSNTWLHIRDGEVFRQYFGGVPLEKKLREARWSLLSNKPSILTLFEDSEDWTKPSKSYFVPSANVGREIQFARLLLKGAIENYLEDCITSDAWPTPPKIDIDEFDVSKSVIFKFSIYSGGGTTKLIRHFIRQDRAQSCDDILLIAESHGIDEVFYDLYNVALNLRILCVKVFKSVMLLMKYTFTLLETSQSTLHFPASNMLLKNSTVHSAAREK